MTIAGCDEILEGAIREVSTGLTFETIFQEGTNLRTIHKGVYTANLWRYQGIYYVEVMKGANEVVMFKEVSAPE